MIKQCVHGYYAEEFNKFLDDNRKDYMRESEHEDWMTTYLCAPEELTEEENEEFPNCKCVCFRIPGYTIGHLIVDIDNGNIIRSVVVYDRPVVHAFDIPLSDFERVLKDKFEGAELK